MYYKVNHIIYDTDTIEENAALPQELTLCVTEDAEEYINSTFELEEYLADLITNATNYLVESFDYCQMPWSEWASDEEIIENYRVEIKNVADFCEHENEYDEYEAEQMFNGLCGGLSALEEIMETRGIPYKMIFGLEAQNIMWEG